MLNFEQLGLDSNLLKTIKELGFTEPTQIQSEAIPFLMEHNGDFVGQAQTGTGKTAAFVLPLLSKLNLTDKKIQALIVTPTRELANQVYEEVKKFIKYVPVRTTVVYGGAAYDKQIRSIKEDKPQIIVGTPGRLMDLMERGVLNFKTAKHVILDEADEMLNMGFFDDIQQIITSFDKDRQIWMFSATMPSEIQTLINANFNDPKYIRIKKGDLNNINIEQKYYVVRNTKQTEALFRILDANPEMYGLIFCRTKEDTKVLAEDLSARGYSSEVLHGDLSQAQRQQAMHRFKNKRANLMVCTDVASRGIDVSNLTHVINMGIPQDFESYVHRIGRTGRAGLKGTALTILEPRQIGFMERLERFTNTKIQKDKLPNIEDVKKILIKSKLHGLTSLIKDYSDKTEEIKIDKMAYGMFNDKFQGLEKDDILKIIFTWSFNKELDILDNFEDIDVDSREPRRCGNSRSYSSSNNRNRSGGNRNSGDKNSRSRNDRNRSDSRNRNDRNSSKSANKF